MLFSPPRQLLQLISIYSFYKITRAHHIDAYHYRHSARTVSGAVHYWGEDARTLFLGFIFQGARQALPPLEERRAGQR